MRRQSRRWSHNVLATMQRVNFALRTRPLAFRARERIGTAADFEAQWNRADAKVAAHRVQQIPPIALRKLVEPISEYHEAWRAAFDLGDVAKLDPLALRRW